MRILLASSEVYPYSKTGGLADMAGSLAKCLAAAGQEVLVVTPLYRSVRQKAKDLAQSKRRLALPLGREVVKARIYTLEPAPGLSVYFIDQPAFYDRPALYGEGRPRLSGQRRAVYLFFQSRGASLPAPRLGPAAHSHS